MTSHPLQGGPLKKKIKKKKERKKLSITDLCDLRLLFFFLFFFNRLSNLLIADSFHSFGLCGAPGVVVVAVSGVFCG